MTRGFLKLSRFLVGLVLGNFLLASIGIDLLLDQLINALRSSEALSHRYWNTPLSPKIVHENYFRI
jgi:hypothetical protein